ncbi:MAG TPA: CPBP family intramembrane metalloprotease [Lactobacillus sp.]|uniref:CPBP family intramembrane metalloprotease n=1 Tax=Companilactobacillus formosensis TaxID=1617889 RepID=A0A2P4R666_9LACO|nr:CPBP family intramembrane metalloprotease [Lactobacillus sp.]
MYKVISLVLLLILNFSILKQKIYFKTVFNKTNWKSNIILFGFVLFIVGSSLIGKSSQRVIEAFTIGIIAGIPEEYLFRGIVLGSLLKNLKFKNQSRRIIVSIIIASLLFSLYHFGNIRYDGFQSVFLQMIQTFGMGFLLATAYVRYASILIPILLHFSINFGVTLVSGTSTSTASSHLSFAILLIDALIVAAFYIIIGMLLLRNHLKNNPLIKKLDLD